MKDSAILNIRILVIGPPLPYRTMILEALSAVGFTNIRTTDDCKSALEIMLLEPIHWVLTQLLFEQNINALQMLKVSLENPTLHKTRISLFYKQNEEKYLDAAFSLGLMSCHSLENANTQSLFEALNTFSNQENFNRAGAAILAADYLREHLAKKKAYKEIIEIDEKLLNIFPGSPKVLARLGEYQMLNGDLGDGLNSLKQAALIDEKFEGTSQESIKRARSDGLKSNPNSNPGNVLRLKSCVIIDPDTAVLRLVGEMMEELGVPLIEKFEDGETAWKWISENPEPSLILQEWKIPRLSGMALMQRIRQYGYVNTIIVGMTASIKPTDTLLLREMGVDNVIPKPFGQRFFIKSLIWTLQQNSQPTDQRAMERKIRRHLEKEELTDACRYKVRLFDDEKTTLSTRKNIDAQFAFYINDFLTARDLAIEALKTPGDALSALTIAGKSLLKLTDYPSAAKFFQKVASISPSNIEHLCNLARGHFEIGEIENSDEAIIKAKRIDKNNNFVARLELEKLIIANRSEEIQELKDLLGANDYLILVQNIARRAGEFLTQDKAEEGIRLYQQTIELIPDHLKDLQDTLRYNLSLAYARSGDLEKAKASLDPILARLESLVYGKAASFLKMVADAEASGELVSVKDAELNMSSVPNKKNIDSILQRALISAREVQQGEICLYKLYNVGLNIPEVERSLSMIPDFKNRKSA